MYYLCLFYYFHLFDYFEKKKWIPAINRFRVVVDKYERTIYIEEALHRLVEIYYTLGLIEESRKYANILGFIS